MKSATKYSLLLLIVSTCLLSYCSKAPTSIDRDNVNDPDNPIFEIPASKGFYTQIEADKAVQISWTDSTNYIDGYVLSKSIDGISFEVLDTLETSTNTYTDTTGDVTVKTKYTLYSYRKVENGYKNSDTLTTGISFGKISLDTYSVSSDTSTFNLSWQFDNSWPFIIVTKLTIYNDPSVFDVKSSTQLDTLYNQETSYVHELMETFDYYYLSFDAFLNQEDLDNGNAYDSLNIYPYQYLKMNFSPQITSTQIIDESSVRLNWEDNSTFEDGFEILRSDTYTMEPSEVIATLTPNTTTFVDSLSPFLNATPNPFGGYDTYDAYYSVRAIKGSSKTSYSTGKKVTLDVPPPSLTITEENANTVKLSWSISSLNYVKNFILERSIDGSGFQTYKTFDKNTTEYTVTELDTTKKYSFRVRTIKSPPSNVVNISSLQGIIEKESFDFPGATSIRSSKSDKYLVASSGYYNHSFSSNDVVVFDLENGTEIYRATPFENPVDGVDINEDKHLIGMVSSKDRSVRIMDFVADTIVYELLNDDNNSFFDIEFSPDGDYFYTVTAFGALSKFSLLTKTHIFSTSTASLTGTNRSLSVSPTGDSIAVSVFGTHQLYSKEGTLLNFQTLPAKGSYSQGVSFSKSGEFLISIRDSDFGAVQVTSDGYELYNFTGHYADLHYTNRYLAIFHDGVIKVIDFWFKRELRASKFISAPELTQLRYSNNHDYFFFGTDSSIKLYELSDSKIWVQSD